MRGFVDNAKRCKQKNDMESFVNCMPYCILFLLYFDVLTSYWLCLLCNQCIVMIKTLYSLETFWNDTELYGINASIMQRQAGSPSSRVLIICPTDCNGSRLHLFVVILVQIASSRCYDLCSFIWHVYQMYIRMIRHTSLHTTHAWVCADWITILQKFTKLKDLPSL